MLETIMTRRSIRKYKDKAVEAEKIDIMLRAAMAAPSAVNKQPWHFIVCDDRALLEEMSTLQPYAKMLAKAPLAIVVCGDTNLHNGPNYYMLDCSNAAENILLAAHELGLGACWVAASPREERIEAFSKTFKLPENIMPLCAIAIGYPDEERKPEDRFKPERIHYNKW